MFSLITLLNIFSSSQETLILLVCSYSFSQRILSYFPVFRDFLLNHYNSPPPCTYITITTRKIGPKIWLKNVLFRESSGNLRNGFNSEFDERFFDRLQWTTFFFWYFEKNLQFSSTIFIVIFLFLFFSMGFVTVRVPKSAFFNHY